MKVLPRSSWLGLTAAMTLCLAPTFAETGSPLSKKILELFPQADRNKDGVLSKKEEAALSQQALRRHPQADADGDGVLSTAEKQALLRQAAARAQRGTAKAKQAAPAKGRQTPSFANVKYGDHERQALDLWLADTEKPAPLAVYIHGGGFKAGSKEKLNAAELSGLLKAGISVASINYRYSTIAPLPAAHHDARRALQFMRANADKWNIDKDRVAAFGGSAGAQICMWLAFSQDMADSDSADPIARESTRLVCVATKGGQTGNSKEFWQEQVGSLLGGRSLESLSKPLNGESDPEKVRIATWGAKNLAEANAIADRHAALSLISSDDPPIFMSYGMAPDAEPPRNPQRLRGWLIHHVNLGTALKKKTDALKLEAHLHYPGANCKYKTIVAFFADKLRQ